MRVLGAAIVALLAPHAATPAAPHPMLPSLARVRVEVGKDRCLVLHDVNLPRGDWTGGDLDLFASFGVAFPTAIDARIVALGEGDATARGPEAGESVGIERAPRRPANAHLIVGRPTMAGVVLKLKDGAFRRATAPGGVAQLRLREVLPLGDAARPLPVRLGAAAGQPIAVLRLELAALAGEPPIEKGSARLCGPDADPSLLTLSPRSRGDASLTVLPYLATRRPTDDLCFDWSR